MNIVKSEFIHGESYTTLNCHDRQNIVNALNTQSSGMLQRVYAEDCFVFPKAICFSATLLEGEKKCPGLRSPTFISFLQSNK